MAQQSGSNSVGEYEPCFASLSEPESYTEHQAALDATLFRPDGDVAEASELVLELEAGKLRVRTGL